MTVEDIYREIKARIPAQTEHVITYKGCGDGDGDWIEFTLYVGVPHPTGERRLYARTLKIAHEILNEHPDLAIEHLGELVKRALAHCLEPA